MKLYIYSVRGLFGWNHLLGEEWNWASWSYYLVEEFNLFVYKKYIYIYIQASLNKVVFSLSWNIQNLGSK